MSQTPAIIGVMRTAKARLVSSQTSCRTGNPEDVSAFKKNGRLYLEVWCQIGRSGEHVDAQAYVALSDETTPVVSFGVHLYPSPGAGPGICGEALESEKRVLEFLRENLDETLNPQDKILLDTWYEIQTR